MFPLFAIALSCLVGCGDSSHSKTESRQSSGVVSEPRTALGKAVRSAEDVDDQSHVRDNAIQEQADELFSDE